MRSVTVTSRMPSLLVAAMVSVFASQASAVKFGDPKAGEEKAQACAACHGVDNDNPQFPRIAGQHPDYLLYALKSYKNGDRQNAVMNGQVSNLSVEDMKDLAAYYGSLESDLEAVELE